MESYSKKLSGILATSLQTGSKAFANGKRFGSSAMAVDLCIFHLILVLKLKSPRTKIWVDGNSVMREKIIEENASKKF